MPTQNDLVVKSNALVPAMAKLGLMELRLLAFCIAHVKPGDTSFEPVTAAAKDISELYDIPIDRAYSLIKEVMININSKPAEYSDDHKRSISVWFTDIDYMDGHGNFTFHLNNRLAKYLLGLKENFTAYRIKDVYQFKAATTWHVYETLRQYKNAAKVEFYLEKFKALVGIAGKYKRFHSFKSDFLRPAINEINEKSDIKVQFELKKSGTKVEGIRFFIAKNDDTMTRFEKQNEARRNSTVQPNADPEFSKMLRDEYKMAPQQAKQLASLVDYHGCKEKALKLLPKLKRRYDALQQKKTSLGGYVFRALREELTQGSLCEGA